MSFSQLLSDSCTIYNRTVTEGMTDTESWTAQSSAVPCRVLKKSHSFRTEEKTQRATYVSTVFVLKKSATIAVRDRISHESRMYEVVEVVTARGASQAHHKNAICEAIV